MAERIRTCQEGPEYGRVRQLRDNDSARRHARELIGNGPSPKRFLDALAVCDHHLSQPPADANHAYWHKVKADVERRYRAYLGKPPRDWRYPHPDTK